MAKADKVYCPRCKKKLRHHEDKCPNCGFNFRWLWR